MSSNLETMTELFASRYELMTNKFPVLLQECYSQLIE
jgi:hypothetical protein